MEKYLTLIFAAIILSGCVGKPSIDNPEKRNENWSWFVDKETGVGQWIPLANETTVKNGYYSLFFCNGVIRQSGKLKNGVDIDTTFYFDIQGALIAKTFLDINGELQEIIPDGKHKSYYPTCELLSEGEYKNNIPIGILTDYFKNGKVNFKFIPVNDSTWTILEFYQNGQMRDSATKINDELEGIVKRWYPNGQLEAIGRYKNGMKNGVCTWYFENGQIDTECNFSSDIPNGTLTSFYENGNLKSKGLLKNGKEEGILLHYFENGQLDNKVNFSNGKKNGELWFYHPNGQLKKHAISKNDVTTYYKSYNEDGKLIQEYDGNEVIDYEQ